jgi:hypothetical protein
MKLKSAIGAILLALGTSGVALHADTATATVDLIKGNVYATDASGKSKKLSTGDTISVGSLVHTNADSVVKLKLVPGASTVITPGSDVVLTTLDYTHAAGVKTRTVKLTLQAGEVVCSLVKHDGHSTFQVITPKGTSTAVGTDWSVSYSASSGLTIVSTLDGTVTLQLPNGKTVSIPGGQVTSTNGTTTISANLTEAQIAVLDDALKGIVGSSTYTGTAPSNPANNSLGNAPISPTE